MYEKTFKLQIVTPNKVVYQDQASSLSAPGTQGGFQILYNHAPFISTIDIGEIKVKNASGKDALFATSGGFVEVKNNDILVLAETAEPAGEIDVERARAAENRARERLSSKDPDTDVDRARVSMMRSLNRLRIAGKD